MPIAKLPGATVHYELDGPEGAPVVVLSNSLGSDMGMWDGQIAGLAERFRVLRYDTRGHGGSAGAGSEYALADLGGDVVGLLDELGIARAHVCGVSLGGITALWMAIEAPDRVLSVMPCNTAARIGSEASWKARIEQIAAHGIASIADATMERWFTEGFRASAPVRVEATRQMLLRTDAAGYMACCAALRDADLRAGIGSIAAPALVMCGTHDPVTPPPDGRFLQEHIAGAGLCELEASHLSPIELPEAFLGAMLGFLGAM